MKFRSKPVEIEAFQLTGDYIDGVMFNVILPPLPPGLTFRGEVVPSEQTLNGKFICQSRQGEVEAAVDDWIVTEPGEGFESMCYPCKPDVFAAKYEPIDGKSSGT